MRKIIAVVLLVVGLLFAGAGVAAWAVTEGQLSDSKVTVAEDADPVLGIDVAGEEVDGPLTAYAQAEIIDKHALEATGGKTYAEMDQEDPMRELQALSASLRTSLFASIMAFGVSAMAVVLGLLALLGGAALLRVDSE